MIKKHKKTFIFTSLIVLLPVLAGLVMWNRLPESLPSHWGFDGNVDGWSSKAMAVFGLPLILLVAHWVCIGATLLDKRNARQNSKALSMVWYIIPVVSLLSCATVYTSAFGREIDMTAILPLLMGALFILIGNYLPKCRLNATLGIKLPWTLANEENWNRTHRFGGKVWVAGGAAMLIAAFLPVGAFTAVMLAVFLIAILCPCLYSYLLYRRQKTAGTWEVNGVVLSPTLHRFSAVMVAVILVFVAILMFTGNIEYAAGDDALSVTASYWTDSEIPYSAITAVELREEGVDGTRTSGFGSARLLMGQFRNDEFGYYTRYTYTGDAPAIVLTLGEQIMVIGAKDADTTRMLYDTLLTKTAQ